MKIIVAIIISLIALTSAIREDKQTLEKWFNEVNINYQNLSSESLFFEDINQIRSSRSCMSINMDWWENKGKKLNFAEAMILIYGSGLNCVSDKLQTIKNMIGMFVDFYKIMIPNEHIECFKMELQNLIPTSFLLSNYNNSTNKNSIEDCSKIVDTDGITNHIEKIEEKYGQIIKLTCDKYGNKGIKVILHTIVVLSNDKIEDAARSRGIKKISTNINDNLDTILNCIKNSIKNRKM